MRGIIYKDFLIACLPKNILSLLTNVVVSLGVIYLFPNMYGLALTVALSIPVSGSSLLQTAMEQDELSNFDKIQLTFPMTKKEIILSKYIGGLMLQVIFFIISFVVAIYYCMNGVASFVTAMQMWVLGIIVGLIFFAVSYVGFYLLGNKKGTIVYIVLAIISCILYIITYFSFDMMAIFTMNYNVLLAIGMIIAIIFLVMSYLISVKLYTKKFS